MRRLLTLCAILSLAVIQPYTTYAIGQDDFNAATFQTSWAGSDNSCAANTTTPAQPGDGSLLGVTMPNTDTTALASAIDTWIAKTQANSPLKGYGKIFVQYGSQYNVNPALAVAMANKENSLGTAGVNVSQNNALNIGHQEPADGIGQNTNPFKSYSDFSQNIQDYNYILKNYYIGKGLDTVQKIINQYAPPSDGNNTTQYTQQVTQWMTDITAGLSQSGSGPSTPAASASDVLDGYKLPADQGGSGSESATTGLAFDPPKTPDELTYYITMRWTYASWNWDGTDSIVEQKQYDWLAQNHPRVLVTDQRTNKSVIADVLEAGPAPWTGTAEGQGNPPSYWSTAQVGTPAGYDGRVSGLAPAAFQALGAQEWVNGNTGDQLEYEWAPDQTAALGPTSTSVSSAPSCSNGSTAPGNGSNSTIVQDAIKEYNLHLIGTGPLQNDGPVCKYQGSACGEAWCADFVSWIYNEAGKPFTGGLDGGWRLSLASDTTGYFLARRGQPGIGYGSTAGGGDPMEPGWVVSFAGADPGVRGIGHVGIITKVNSDGTFDDIEGNGAGPGVSENQNLSQSSAIDWGGDK